MNRKIELKYKKNGFSCIVGLDEVGRGAIAGPIVAGAVILPSDVSIGLLQDLNDSKKLSKSKRQYLSNELQKICQWSVGVVSSTYIDRIGIAKANAIAFQKAIKKLKTNPDLLLVDYFSDIGSSIKTVGITRGDSKVASIAAASIIAKVWRDAYMIRQAKKYPEYGFETHVGYGTKRHKQAIGEYGLIDLHRRSFCRWV